MQRFALAALASVGTFSGSNALAVVDAQIMGGARTATVEYQVNDEDRKKDVKSTEIGFAAHLSPSKILPVAFGVFANMNKYDTTPIVEEQIDEEEVEGTSFSEPTSSITGTTYGPEVMAWVPIPMFKPYLRASYLMGNYDYKNKAGYDDGMLDGDVEQTITYKTTGYNVGVGFIYSPVPLLGLVVEYNLGAETLTATKGSAKVTSNAGVFVGEAEDDIDVDAMDDEDKTKTIGSNAIRLGLSLSI